jgi:hypothetical protein
MRLVTLGVGAAASPRYAPAGLLVSHRGARVAIDGGPGAEPGGRLDAWLVTDERAELMSALRTLAARHGLTPRALSTTCGELSVSRRAVVHTNHPAYGYRLTARGRAVAWAPEFVESPRWAAGADLMLAEAAGWDRPIRFTGGVGGHLDTLSVSSQARRLRVRRLVFAHIGRPTIRALDRGDRPDFGTFGSDGQVFWVR